MRKFALVFVLVTLLCLSTSCAFADNSCGANLKWNLSTSGVLTISGTGDMMDCDYGSAPWDDLKDSIKSVVVEEGVTSIGGYAFYWCRELLDVQLPSSLTAIDRYAFENCADLLSVNIPTGVTTIGDWTFYGCESLSSITLPEGLTSINDLAFSGCDSLRELIIPASVVSISDDRVFMGCDNLERISVSKDNPSYISVDGILFNKDQSILLCYPAGKADASYSLPDTVTNINKYAFYWNEHIQSITVPESVKTIGGDAFAGCSKLTNLILSEGIESIGSTAFHNAEALTSITFPASLMSLGDDVFDSCYSLTSINVADGSKAYVSVDGVLYTADMTTLVAFPGGFSQASYTIPDGVTTIGEYAFLYNHNIVSITFPESLITIGRSAFSGCDKIASLQFPSNLVTIDDGAFSSCDGLTSIVLPYSVLILGNGAFDWCDHLVSVTVKNPATCFDKWGVFDYGNDGLTFTGLAGSTTETFATAGKYRFVETTFEDDVSTKTSDSWVCTNCNATMHGGMFCSECGTAKPEAQKCTNCGYEVPDGVTVKFCPECGTKMN